MSATIFDMDYRIVDTLNVDQLEPSDLIEISGDIVQVKSIIPIKNGYAITWENEFGEKDLTEVDDYARFDLYVYLD